MSFSGRLLDSEGAPIIYTDTLGNPIAVDLPAHLWFFSSKTAASSFHDTDSTATAHNSYFSVPFSLPAGVSTSQGLWFELAVDADRNGLSGADRFGERFEIGAVPFALSTVPLNHYTIHGGLVSSSVSTSAPPDVMYVAPFETPSGGLEFNTMAVTLGGADSSSTVSFGIYDTSGTLVVSSGLIEMKDVNFGSGILEVTTPKVTLEPATVYYTGLKRSGWVFVRRGLLPAGPVYGKVSTGAAGVAVPATFDPSSITIDLDALIAPITVTLVEPGTGTLSLQGADASNPRVRWFPSGSPAVRSR